MRSLFAILSVSLTLLCACTAAAQQSRVVIDDYQISKYVTDVKSSFRLPSVAVGIVGPDETHYLEAYGPAELDQRFRLGSLSKTYTALAALLLAHEGKFSLDDPVANWFPEAPEDVTVQDLLDHTSGVSAADGYAPMTAPDASVGDWIAGASWAGVGEYEYSNLNYVILGALLQRAADEPFDEILRTRIFEPIGLESALASEDSREVVPGYQYMFGFPVQRTAPPIPAAELPAGGVMASPKDTAKFLRVLLNDGKAGDQQIFPPAVVKQMLTAPEGKRYASGWGRITIDGVDVAMHSGLTATFASFQALAPAREVGVFAVTNVNSYNAGAVVAIGKGVLRTMIGARPQPVSNLEFVVRLGMGILLVIASLAFLLELMRWFSARRPVRMRRRWVIRFAVLTVLATGVMVALWQVTETPLDALFRFQPDVALVVVGVPGSLILRQLFKGFNASFRERHLEE
jgi:CubicO group peptidase (beta-lactamase class C family)